MGKGTTRGPHLRWHVGPDLDDLSHERGPIFTLLMGQNRFQGMSDPQIARAGERMIASARFRIFGRGRQRTWRMFFPTSIAFIPPHGLVGRLAGDAL